MNWSGNVREGLARENRENKTLAKITAYTVLLLVLSFYIIKLSIFILHHVFKRVQKIYTFTLVSPSKFLTYNFLQSFSVFFNNNNSSYLYALFHEAQSAYSILLPRSWDTFQCRTYSAQFPLPREHSLPGIAAYNGAGKFKHNLSPPTGSPFIHLGREQQCGVDKLPCWRTKVPWRWWDSNPDSQRESSEYSNIYTTSPPP